jgi:hypothetical protein
VGEEPNHTNAIKPGPLQIIQYSLVCTVRRQTHRRENSNSVTEPEPKFLVPDWGVCSSFDYGIGLSCRPARPHRLAGLYGTLYAKVDYSISPSQGIRI